MKKIFALSFLLLQSSFAFASVTIHSLYEPIPYSRPSQTGCAISFEPHEKTNSKILIMTYSDSDSRVCAIRGQSIAFQCDGYFCHSGDSDAYKTHYLALYTSADAQHLLLRINHCTSGCGPFGTVIYQPLPPQNANYKLKSETRNP